MKIILSRSLLLKTNQVQFTTNLVCFFLTIFEFQLLKTTNLFIMKKLLLILSILAFTNLSFAQERSTSDAQVRSASDAQVSSLKDVAKTTEAVTKSSSKDVQRQIQNGLTTNDELAAMGADYLKGNSDTSSAFSKIYKDNKGSINQTMKAVMANPKLKSSVMDWINGNPEVMNKALGMLGM